MKLTRKVTIPQGTTGGRPIFRATLLLGVMLALAFSVSAQTNINPATSTKEFGGQPNLTNSPADFTFPRGGIVLNGTAISTITGRPVRHLWVGDNVFGLCRTDPEIDAPGSHDINPNTCPFKLGGQSVTGGPMLFDPTNDFLYLVDVRRSQGVYRLHYQPDGDTGQGFLDFTSIFAMAGNPTAARFQGGQTGCPLPTNSTLPTNPNFGSVDFAALGPDGNLWIAGTNSGGILRINNPATASSTGFGTCSDFVQLVATTPDNASSNGLAWIGHDLWGADGTAPFAIRNADTTCQALGDTPTQVPTCTATANLAAVGAVTTLTGDQQFPQLNGNNLYFATTAPGQVFWAGNVSGSQTLDLTYINTAQLPQPAPPATQFPPLGTFGATAVDYTDPSNLAVFSGEDASNTGALGAGRWWQTCLGVLATHCQTPTATAAPTTPTIIRASAGNGTVTLSWSASQNHQPVTSYTIHNSSISGGSPIPDVTVTATAPNPFPPTTVTIPAPNGRSYAFQVRATNARGSSGFTSPSNTVAVPGASLPGTPTQASASEGNRSAFVTWAAPTSGGAITSYKVTALALNPTTGTFTRTQLSTTVAATGTSAVVNNLTNGTTYEFSVHASNTTGSGLESTPSNAVIPTSLPALAVTMGGPTDLLQVPIQVTYPVTITNNTTQAFSAVNLTDTLTTTDGATSVAFHTSCSIRTIRSRYSAPTPCSSSGRH